MLLRQSTVQPTSRFTRRTSFAARAIASLLILLAGCEVRRIDPSGVDRELVSDTLRTEDHVEAMEDVPGPNPSDSRTLEQRLSDASVSAHVKLALVAERRLRRFEIDPVAQGGIVLLRGDVSSNEERILAERVAREVKGVRGIRNALEVPGMAALPDTADLPLAVAPVDSATVTARRDTITSQPVDVPEVGEPAPSTASDIVYHTVRSGDSLWEIARQHGTTVDAIRRLNDMQGDRLRPGERLRVR